MADVPARSVATPTAVGLLLAGLLAAAGQARPVGATAGWRAQPSASAALAMREVGRGDQSNIDGLREVVVRSQSDWQKLWREHDYDRPVPRVDFGKDMVVAVFLGSQTSAGHSVRIAEVAAAGDAVVVKYQADRPGAGGVAAQVLTFPFHIVAVASRPGAVRFERNLP